MCGDQNQNCMNHRKVSRWSLNVSGGRVRRDKRDRKSMYKYKYGRVRLNKRVSRYNP